MSNFHLISHYLCPYVQRAVIVLNEKNIKFERTNIDLANKPDWFLKKSPIGRVPLLETDGQILFESQVIAEYLDEVTNGSLHPKDILEKAKHRSWIEYGSETLNAIGAFYSAKTEEEFLEKRKILLDKIMRLEKEITLPFFSGDKFHMVDGVWGTIFRYFEVFDQIENIGLTFDSKYLLSWRKAVLGRDSIINAVSKDYSNLLMQFLKNKNTYISKMIVLDK